MSDTTTHVPMPVHLGDLTGPAGNVFAILGQLRGAKRQIEREAGVKVHPGVDALLSNYQNMTYEQILDAIEECCDDLDDSVYYLRMERDDDDDD